MEPLLVYNRHTKDEMDAYERLLGDAMKGDSALFAREEGITWTHPYRRNAF
jgi:glucose-6-phosphate 1-dehydrogenase